MEVVDLYVLVQTNIIKLSINRHGVCTDPFFMIIISGSMNNCAVVGSGVVRCWGYDTHLKEVQTEKVE